MRNPACAVGAAEAATTAVDLGLAVGLRVAVHVGLAVAVAIRTATVVATGAVVPFDVRVSTVAVLEKKKYIGVTNVPLCFSDAFRFSC